MSGSVSDWIHLTGVSFPCVLGLLEWEQREPQRLDLELSMNLDLDPAAGGDLSHSINYAATLEQVQFIAQHGRWMLLESMAAAIARCVLAPIGAGERRGEVKNVIVRLRKPDVFRGRAVPWVEIHRSSSWCRMVEVPGPTKDARVEILQTTAQTGAYRVQLAAGADWRPPAGAALFVVAGAIKADEKESPSGMAIARGVHLVEATAAATLLAVSQPPLPGLGQQSSV